MRNFSRWLVSGLMISSALCVQAQETAVKAVADGHYMGAKQQLERFLDEQPTRWTQAHSQLSRISNKEQEEAEALLLVCDYVLGTPGTADRMDEWVESHPVSSYGDVVRAFRRNLLVKENRQDEAVEAFLKDEATGWSLDTPLPYPLTGLTEEAYSYNNVLYRLAGEKLYDEGRYGRALPYLEIGEKTRTSQYKQGMCYYHNGAWDNAFQALVASAGNGEDEMAQNALLHAGIAALQRGNKSNARKAFFLASKITANPSLREQALYNYCLTLHEEKADNTVGMMEQFLNEFPTSRYATPIAGCLTEVYMSKKNYTKALNAISKVPQGNAAQGVSAVQADKQKVLYHLAFQELSGNHLQEALTYASQAIAMGKQDVEAYAEAYYVRGDCNYRLGNYDQAANDLNTAINLGMQTPTGKLNNNEYAIYSLGYAQFKQQKYNAAIAQFQKITETEGVNASVRADALNRIGDCYLNMRNYDEANNHYAAAKATDHTMGDYSMLQQAYIEGLRGNYNKKVQLIEQMRAEYPASSQGAKALYEQGRAYVLSGREDEAAALFGSIAARYPQSEYAQKASEELANMTANIAMQDSIAAAQEAQAIEAAKAPVVAAQQLFNAGEYQQAETLLNKAIDEGIGKPYWLARAFILLSDIYRAEGRTVEAKQTLESLKANYKEDDDIRGMIEQRLQNNE